MAAASSSGISEEQPLHTLLPWRALRGQLRCEAPNDKVRHSRVPRVYLRVPGADDDFRC